MHRGNIPELEEVEYTLPQMYNSQQNMSTKNLFYEYKVCKYVKIMITTFYSTFEEGCLKWGLPETANTNWSVVPQMPDRASCSRSWPDSLTNSTKRVMVGHPCKTLSSTFNHFHIKNIVILLDPLSIKNKKWTISSDHVIMKSHQL